MFKIAVLLAMLAVVMGTTGMPDDETEIETDRIKGTGVESSRSAPKVLVLLNFLTGYEYRNYKTVSGRWL